MVNIIINDGNDEKQELDKIFELLYVIDSDNKALNRKMDLLQQSFDKVYGSKDAKIILKDALESINDRGD